MAKNDDGIIGNGCGAVGGIADILRKNESDNIGVYGEQIKTDDDIQLDENGHLPDEVLEKYRAQMIAAAKNSSKKKKEDATNPDEKPADKGIKEPAPAGKVANTPEEFLAMLELTEDEKKELGIDGTEGDGKGSGDGNKGGDNVDPDTITALCDVVTEAFGIELTDEEKPKDVEKFAETIISKLSERAKPEYANEELEALDAYVRQGGNMQDYFAIEREFDIDSIDINDETDQKNAVKFLHKLQGIKPELSNKKIERLVSGGLLKDEAEDAVDAIKNAVVESKANLLKERELAYKAEIKRQQDFVENVKTTINSTTEIYGAKVPEADKQALMKFLFKPTAKGTTAYKEAFDAHYEQNLIATAYLLMKGKTLIESAQQRGSTQAMEALKKKLLGSSNGKGRAGGTAGDAGESAALQSFLRRF
jgi:hypothetical protein